MGFDKRNMSVNYKEAPSYLINFTSTNIFCCLDCLDTVLVQIQITDLRQRVKSPQLRVAASVRPVGEELHKQGDCEFLCRYNLLRLVDFGIRS